MGLKRKQMQLRQKAYFEQELKNRLSFLAGKGIEAPKSDKDAIVKNLKANIRATDRRLRFITGYETRTQELAKAKADKAAALLKEKEGGKVEKPVKAAAEGKEKKIKADKKAAPPKAKEGGKSQKTAEAPEEGTAKKE
jgi:hypothetical protein